MTVAKKVRKCLVDLYKYLYGVPYKISAIRMVRILCTFLTFKVQILKKILKTKFQGEESNNKNAFVALKIPKKRSLKHNSK